jgi:hypothetical protein
MALEPAQKASLALRIVAARCSETYAAAPNYLRALNAIGRMLKEWADTAEDMVTDDSAVATHLLKAASALQGVATTFAAVRGVQEQIRKVDERLRRLADGMRPGDGDGPALRDANVNDLAPAAPYCKCGFLDLAEKVEGRARSAYNRANALQHGFPAIHYETSLVEDPEQDLAPFRVGGGASITLAPRVVRLRIEDGDLRPRDLCQIPYVFFHEIVCHAFQAVGPDTTHRNAPASCRWTEAWMDKIAFEMARLWIHEEEKGWLPRRAVDAEDDISAVHRLRYLSKKEDRDAKLSKIIAKDRRSARAALDALRDAFVENGIANGREEAAEIVERFSFIANAHPQTNPKILDRTVEYLLPVLLTDERAHQRGRVADACYEFIADPRFDELERKLQIALTWNEPAP